MRMGRIEGPKPYYSVKVTKESGPYRLGSIGIQESKPQRGCR